MITTTQNKNNKQQYSKLIRTIVNGDCNALREILGEHLSEASEYREARFTFEPKPDFNTLPFDGLTLLHIAAYADSFDCFYMLVVDYNFPLNAKSANSKLPIHYACFSSAFEIVTYIIQTDPSQATCPGLLKCATISNNSIILECLFMHGASLNFNNVDDKDAIKIAIYNPDRLCFNTIKKYSSIDSGKDDYPLSLLCAINQLPELILDFFKVDDLKRSFHNENNVNEPITLMSALVKSCPENKDIISKILAQAQSAGIDLELPGIGEGVCHWACKLCDTGLAEQMFNLGHPKLYRTNKANQLGPSVMASTTRLTDQEIINMLQYLIKDRNFDINMRPNQGPTVLESFILAQTKYVRPEVVRALLFQFKADPRLKLSKLSGTILEKGKKLRSLANIFIEWEDQADPE